MPLYFAYGSNMDRDAMRRRCPNSRPLGRARLARHRFFIMASGHGSVKRDPRMDVYGVLFDLAFADIPGLDRYEELGRRLYQKVVLPVLRNGAAPVQALLYVGGSVQEGEAKGDYLDRVIAAARTWDFPDAYLSHLSSLAGQISATHAAGARRTIRLKAL